MNLVHTPTFRLNSLLFAGFLVIAVRLGLDLPERYPVHFSFSGDPTRWAEGPGMWILLIALCTMSFGQIHLFQRFLITDPDSTLLNVPHKERFLKLPTARKVVVLRRANRMLGVLNTGMLLLFLLLLFMVYHSGHHPGSPLTVLASHSLLILVVLMVVYPLAEAFALGRMIRRKLQEEGLW